jgi:TRAP-type C4-dicarboxylate transport system permease small subunit
VSATPPPGRTRVDALFGAIDLLLAGLLLGMVVMVFGNVVLRYVFNSGIGVSEELSRYFFIWLSFIGAISVMRRNGHLGMSGLVQQLGPKGRRLALAITQLLILAACTCLFWGTWRQHEINATTTAPITGLSMIWVFGVAYPTALGIAALSLHTLWRLASGRIGEAELGVQAPHGEAGT